MHLLQSLVGKVDAKLLKGVDLGGPGSTTAGSGLKERDRERR